jgi:hypothetical protein
MATDATIHSYSWYRILEALIRFLLGHPYATAPAEFSITLATSTFPSQPFKVRVVAKSVPKPNVVGVPNGKLLGANGVFWKPTELRERTITIEANPAIPLHDSMETLHQQVFSSLQ